MYIQAGFSESSNCLNVFKDNYKKKKKKKQT